MKPAKVTVYVKLTSSSDPGRSWAVQFGFGQTCVTEPGLAVSCGMVSLPFLVEATVVVSPVEKLVVWDSIGLFGSLPWLKQSTVPV